MQMRFRGQLESGLIAQDHSKGRYWTAIRIPFDPVETWPQRKGMRVRGTINGFPFRTSLFGGQAGGYLLLVNRAIQKQAKVVLGSLVDVVIEPNLEDSSVAPPLELAKLLKADRAVKKWFERLNYSLRNYICNAVADAKSAESRRRRAEQWTECMMLAMEAEIEVPPLLLAAFRRQPRARTGWESMTPIQRRSHLIAIFQLQSPEARAKRAERAVADALGRATRLSGSEDWDSERDLEERRSKRQSRRAEERYE